MPTPQKKLPENPTGFAEAAKKARENLMEPVNCETRFSTDPDKNCDMLCKAAFPNDPGKQEYYKAKIMASLEAHLKEGVSIQALWDHLASKNCQTSAIIDGLLKFFAGEKGENEIDINNFLKPISWEAKSATEKVKLEMHKQQVAQTRLQLNELLAEIRASQA